MRNNPINASIDFDKEGIQHGFLSLPYSRDDSAWGSVMIPITQIKNGDGPTALLTGANHGDEYEGPIALLSLAERTDFSNINGRIIIIPAMNYPAFQTGTRVSPIDSVNLNRAFPGKANGTVTQIIADYFSRTLLPMADYVLDIHSGGKTLDFLPFSACHLLADSEQQARCRAARDAFQAPYQVMMLDIDAESMYDTQVENMGKVFVTTELGGGGTTTPRTVEIAKRGVDNFLIHSGIMAGELLACDEDIVELDMADSSCYLFSQHAGLLEPCVSLGDTVQQGDLMAKIHSTERTGIAPVEYYAKRDGLVIARHVPSLAKMGDCLYVIADVVTDVVK
ncbi:N-alpha-acetyl diaminobutyric acid deacetylase DoeB [Colwellia sp. 39_35_sub15_T18]|nr:N-alpha-acetyl diaminobutyric acid deacetylase DoeB [Colwellia sp. 39_35_sub15_T18]